MTVISLKHRQKNLFFFIHQETVKKEEVGITSMSDATCFFLFIEIKKQKTNKQKKPINLISVLPESLFLLLPLGTHIPEQI